MLLVLGQTTKSWWYVIQEIMPFVSLLWQGPCLELGVYPQLQDKVVKQDFQMAHWPKACRGGRVESV